MDSRQEHAGMTRVRMDPRLKMVGMTSCKRENLNVSVWGHGLCVHILSRRLRCLGLFEVLD